MPASSALPLSDGGFQEKGSMDPLSLARSILSQEAAAIEQLAERLDESFVEAIELILDCGGSVIVTGMGKAGLVGQKIAATLASTGTPSHFMHPAEAIHGDLGRVRSDDVILVLSFSGETEEITRLLPHLDRLGCRIIAMTALAESSLGRVADCTLKLGTLREADPLRLAPSTSTTAMLAMGDALALAAATERQFEPQDFAQFHPGGSLGRKLAKVEEVMRHTDDCRVALLSLTVREVLVDVGQPGRRSGAIMLVDRTGVLRGIFTDSDFARLFEDRREDALDQPIAHVMTPNPKSVLRGAMLESAIEILAERKISELPVVDKAGRPLGLIDITDVVDLPVKSESGEPHKSSEPRASLVRNESPDDDGPITLSFCG